MREQQNYRAAIYCRLSSEDGADHESMSIGNQRALLTEYVQKQGWEVVDTYIDDGFSGTNFDRPGFQRMIADIEKGASIWSLPKTSPALAVTTSCAGSTQRFISRSVMCATSP